MAEIPWIPVISPLSIRKSDKTQPRSRILAKNSFRCETHSPRDGTHIETGKYSFEVLFYFIFYLYSWEFQIKRSEDSNNVFDFQRSRNGRTGVSKSGWSGQRSRSSPIEGRWLVAVFETEHTMFMRKWSENFHDNKKNRFWIELGKQKKNIKRKKKLNLEILPVLGLFEMKNEKNSIILLRKIHW